MRLKRRLKRDRREKPEKRESFEPLGPEAVSDALNPKRMFPFDFPGQNGAWIKKDSH